MTTRKIVTSTLLVGLLAVLGWIVHTRGFGTRLGAKTATLAPPFTTEEAWIVDEIVRDITEMSAYPKASPVVTIKEVRPGGGIYRVTAGDAASSDVDLREAVWSPTAFAVLAHDMFGDRTSPGPAPSDASPVYRSLIDLTPATLVAADAATAKRLVANMRDVAAHEAAALTLAGFGLRESAGRMSDARWAMNRMTAHLAIAAALRGNGMPGVDARLAEATLDTLTDRQTSAIAILDSLSANKGDRAISAWTRALRMRITDDWRLLRDPESATRLEQREFFRARRATTRLSQGTVLLKQMGAAPEADWVRIINSYTVAVNDGGLVRDALAMEQAEYEDVFKRLHGQPIGANAMKALNMPASRCVSADGVHVLPWGAWAEFAERHLSLVISRYESFLRHSIGANDEADTQKLVLKRQLGDLWIFPASTIWWTKGVNGTEADLRYINEAIDELLSAQHRVTARTWAFLSMGQRYEPVRRGLPPPGTWFMKPAPRSAYEAGIRMQEGGYGRSDFDMEAILKAAPYDFVLASEYLRTKYGQKTPVEELERLAGARMHYDVHPIERALELVPDGDRRRVSLLQTSCVIAASSCTDLGYELAKLGRDDEAEKAYQTAFSDPSVDPVAVANRSGWLVRYYASHGRVGPALQLAERSADTGAFVGLATAAHLYERLGRIEDAEQLYQQSRRSYDDYSELLGFYYRAVEVRKKRDYEQAWQQARAQVFPDGLVNTPPSDEKPAFGVYVESDSPAAKRVGLRAGDIIVAVDGWHVANVDQYDAVRDFPEAGPFTLTVWRGHLTNVQIADRAFVPVFQIVNYPVQGWIER